MSPQLKQKTTGQPTLNAMIIHYGSQIEDQLDHASEHAIPSAVVDSLRFKPKFQHVHLEKILTRHTFRYDPPKPRGIPEPVIGADRYDEIIASHSQLTNSQLSLDKFGTTPGYVFWSFVILDII